MAVEPPSGPHIPEIRHAARPRNAFGSKLLEGILPLVFWENARAEGWETPKRQGRQGRGALDQLLSERRRIYSPASAAVNRARKNARSWPHPRHADREHRRIEVEVCNIASCTRRGNRGRQPSVRVIGGGGEELETRPTPRVRGLSEAMSPKVISGKGACACGRLAPRDRSTGWLKSRPTARIGLLRRPASRSGKVALALQADRPGLRFPRPLLSA